MFSRRRRQYVFAACLLFGIGGCVYADICVSPVQTTASGSPSSRKLLNVIVRVSHLILSYMHPNAVYNKACLGAMRFP